LVVSNTAGTVTTPSQEPSNIGLARIVGVALGASSGGYVPAFLFGPLGTASHNLDDVTETLEKTTTNSSTWSTGKSIILGNVDGNYPVVVNAAFTLKTDNPATDLVQARIKNLTTGTDQSLWVGSGTALSLGQQPSTYFRASITFVNQFPASGSNTYELGFRRAGIGSSVTVRITNMEMNAIEQRNI
jgi:hypothetical protein